MDVDALPSEARRLSMPFSRMAEAEAAEAPLITPIEAITIDVDFLDKFAFDIAAMKENIGEDNLESAARGFAENKARFSTLKFNFLELDAKHRFLQELTIDAPLLPKDEVVELEAAVEARHQALKAAKEQYQQDKEAVMALIDSTAAGYDAFVAELEATKAALAELAQLDAEVTAAAAQAPELLELDLSQAQALLAEREAIVRELEATVAARAEQAAAATATQATLERSVTDLRAEHERLVAEAARVEAEEAKRDRSLDGKLAWVTGVLSALQQLAGVEVAVLGPQQLQVILNAPGPKGARRARCVLKLGAFVAPGTPTVQACQILESDVALDTVAASICPTNRPDLLVLALQRRLEEAA